ncbi:MAG: vanadium-dependent haloperoxidase [Parachlamydiales bacterium]
MRLFVSTVLLMPLAVSAISDKGFFDIQRGQRQVEAHTVKAAVAGFDEGQPEPAQEFNGDQQRYADRRGNFNKGLDHLVSGYPDVPAYDSLVRAVSTGTQTDYDAIEIGQGIFRLVNPQAALAFSLPGNDSWLRVIPPAPTFASAQTAGEMVELYWTVLVRDVPFNEFGSNATVTAATMDLSTLTDFRGPKVGGMVTPGTFLRGNTPGDLVGPYISQFLYQNIPYGAATLPQSFQVPLPSDLTVPTIVNDFNYTFPNWFDVVTGGDTGLLIMFDPTPTFIRTPRDLTEFVHRDTPGLAAFSALLILNSYGPAALNPANPYLTNATQDGFVTFGIGQFIALMQEAVQEGLQAAWYHKWEVNRRLRPEEYGFYVQETLVNGASLGINSQLLSSSALPLIFSAFGSYFLAGAYPEGSPVHPAYPAGHATFIGAAVTILKALFNENFIIPVPLEPDATNTALQAYVGTPLTVGGELNKLAANIALGRDHAGVHYRSDGFDGMNLGEQIAIDVLNNNSFLFNESFQGYTFTRFNGEKVTVGGKRQP